MVQILELTRKGLGGTGASGRRIHPIAETAVAGSCLTGTARSTASYKAKHSRQAGHPNGCRAVHHRARRINRRRSHWRSDAFQAASDPNGPAARGQSRTTSSTIARTALWRVADAQNSSCSQSWHMRDAMSSANWSGFKYIARLSTTSETLRFATPVAYHASTATSSNRRRRLHARNTQLFPPAQLREDAGLS